MEAAKPTPGDPRVEHLVQTLTESERLFATGEPAALRKSLLHAETVIESLRGVVATDPQLQTQHLLAHGWMRRGLALSHLGEVAKQPDALRSLDTAISLFRDLFVRHPVAQVLHNLSVSLLAKAELLVYMGGEDNLRQSIACNLEGSDHLACLPEEMADAARRLRIAACEHRATVAEGLRSAEGLSLALKAHSEIVELLRATVPEQGIEQRVRLGAALVNVANIRLLKQVAEYEPSAARASAQEAMSLVAERVRDHALAAEIHIKAAHLMCGAILLGLEGGADAKSVPRDAVNALTDIIDDALVLARLWERRGALDQRRPAEEIFALGLRLFAARQPHFLAEFILEHLDPEKSADAFVGNQAMVAAARAKVAEVLQRLEGQRLVALGSESVERQLEMRTALRHVAARLAALGGASDASVG